MHILKRKKHKNWERYRKLRNECVKLTKRVKKEYFEKLYISRVEDNKTFWKTVKPFFTDKKANSGKVILVENNEIINNDKQNAEIMNEYFVNITKSLDIPEFVTETPPTGVEFIDPIDEIIYAYKTHPSILKINEIIHTNTKFLFNKVTNKQIEKQIIELKSKKSAGADDIPPKIIKDSFAILTPPLTTLFNTSVEEAFFPSNLKNANITPIFKKDDSTKKSNYRPISILPSISKIFERLMFQQMTSYVSNLLSPYLCGFRKGYNAQHALLRLKNSLNKSLDKKESIGLFMMDLSKAFDCMSHNLLIAKLFAYGFSKDSLKLIYSYLKERNQRVKINADYSTWKEILDGVPQGSVLGPLLFNIFINDLFLVVENSEVCNYADDNSLTVADMNIENIINKLESDIKNLNEWFINNGMKLNEDKCQFMLIESSHTIRNEKAKVKIADSTIEEIKKGKLLGITFDKNLTMHDHIKHICKQASNKLYALARISNVLSDHKRKILMKSFVTSQFNYCPVIWMYCQRKSNNMINKIHERALRIAHNDYISDFHALLEKDHSVTFHQRNIQALTNEVYKTLNNLNPDIMKEVFTVKENNYQTRKQYLVYPNPRTVRYGLESFGYKASHIWSNLPKEMQQATNLNTFKRYNFKHTKTVCTCNLCKPYINNLGYI